MNKRSLASSSFYPGEVVPGAVNMTQVGAGGETGTIAGPSTSGGSDGGTIPAPGSTGPTGGSTGNYDKSGN